MISEHLSSIKNILTSCCSSKISSFNKVSVRDDLFDPILIRIILFCNDTNGFGIDKYTFLHTCQHYVKYGKMNKLCYFSLEIFLSAMCKFHIKFRMVFRNLSSVNEYVTLMTMWCMRVCGKYALNCMTGEIHQKQKPFNTLKFKSSGNMALQIF